MEAIKRAREEMYGKKGIESAEDYKDKYNEISRKEQVESKEGDDEKKEQVIEDL